MTREDFTETYASTTTICPDCDDNISSCDECGETFQDSDTVYCHDHDGTHLCVDCFDVLPSEEEEKDESPKKKNLKEILEMV